MCGRGNKEPILATNEAPRELTKQEWDVFMVLMDDVRTEVIEAAKAITGPPNPTLQAQLDALAQAVANPPDTGIPAQLDEVLAILTAPTPRRRFPYYAWPAAVVLAGVVGLVGGWASARCPQDVRTEATLMRQLDPVLVDKYDAMAPALQSAVNGVYAKVGLQPPGQRKGKK
jgi:hypothetical protein